MICRRHGGDLRLLGVGIVAGGYLDRPDRIVGRIAGAEIDRQGRSDRHLESAQPSSPATTPERPTAEQHEGSEELPQARGLELMVFPADWDRYERKAGPLRSAEIVAAANRVVAFWNGRSRGTLNTGMQAVRARPAR